MSKIKQAVILAGGSGTRLLPLTKGLPKPMIPFCGKPFLAYIIEMLQENGIEEVVFLVGFLGEQIEAYFGDGKKFGLAIKYAYTPVRYDTGSRIRDAFRFLGERFLLLYCDNYWSLDIKKLIRFYEKSGREALVTVYDNADNYTKNNMFVNSQGLVEIYDKKRNRSALNGVDIGFFILKKTVLEDLPRHNFSFEEIVIPQLIARKQLSGFLTSEKYYGLSNLQRIPSIEKFFMSKK